MVLFNLLNDSNKVVLRSQPRPLLCLPSHSRGWGWLCETSNKVAPSPPVNCNKTTLSFPLLRGGASHQRNGECSFARERGTKYTKIKEFLQKAILKVLQIEIAGFYSSELCLGIHV